MLTSSTSMDRPLSRTFTCDMGHRNSNKVTTTIIIFFKSLFHQKNGSDIMRTENTIKIIMVVGYQKFFSNFWAKHLAQRITIIYF